MNSFIFSIYFIVLALLPSSIMAASKDICSSAELAKFQELYIELQKKLNYEGTDSYLENGKVKQKKHALGTEYGGQVFEDALFKEYQNSVRKVAMLFQSSKAKGKEARATNDKLVEFFNAIESKDSTSYILNNNISNVIEQLQAESQKKYNDPKDKKFILTNNDKYLLKRLLTHAQDRIISVDEFKNKDQVHFKKDYLKQVSNAPLTRLINVIKNAKITADSNIADTITSIADDKRAMSSAIASNLNDLRKWLNEHQNCRNKIKDPKFIQGKIQVKNYNKFIDALTCKADQSLDLLDPYNVGNLEAVLHFINANEKFLNKPSAQAETAMDELKLEASIDQTFQNLGNKISCVKVDDGSGKSKYFVQNLPFKDNKFDTSKITCTQKGKKISANLCVQSFQLVSDPLGRGLEIAKKNSKAQDLTFSIENGAADCQNVAVEATEVKKEEPKTKTQAECESLNKDEKKFKLSDDKLSCVPGEWSKEECEKLNNEKTKFALSDDKLTCSEIKKETPAEAPKKEEAKKDTPATESKKPEKTPETECKEKIEKDIDETGRPLNRWKWNEKNKKCEEKKTESASEETADAPEQKAAPAYPPMRPAARFQPINIPTRQIYILPGMP